MLCSALTNGQLRLMDVMIRSHWLFRDMSEQQQLRHPSKGTAPRGVTRLCQLSCAYELLPGTLAIVF